MTTTMVLGLGFIVILAAEWRYRLRFIRVGAVVVALLVWFFMLPDAHRAARRAIVMPPAERSTQLPGDPPLSEYQIGVVTMEHAVYDDADMGRNDRLMAIGALIWLACSPAFRRERTLPVAESQLQQTVTGG